MHQLPLQNVLPPPQMAAPHAAGLVAVREAAFDELPAPSEKALAVPPPPPPPVGVHRLLLGRLARPVPPPFRFLLRNVTAHPVRLHPLHHRAAVITLVRNCLFHPVHVHVRLIIGPQLR